MTAATRNYNGLVALILGLGAAGISYLLIGSELMQLGEATGAYNVERMILIYSSLPRLVTSLIAGVALALSGTIFQQALRNPLASPTTMGVSAGAHLALVLAGLFAPALLGFSRELVALAGSGIAACLVFGLVAKRDFSPVALVLAGLIVSLYCGALATLLVLFNDRYLVSLFIWGAGSLSQQDWSVVQSLAPKAAILVLAAGLLARPLGLLQLGDEGSKALGLSPGKIRGLAIAVAVALAAVVTAAVGVIGFIGLVAPTIVRLAGARQLRSQLLWSPLVGALLLWFTDAAIQMLAGNLKNFVPTGAVTALFGSPLLLLLLPRLKFTRPKAASPATAKRYHGPWLIPVAIALAVLGITVVLALGIGRDMQGGWLFDLFSHWDQIAAWRMPRILAALGAGVMLALAGTILQRLTGNEMASPEVLGINAGAMLGIGAALFLFAGSQSMLTACAALGALVILAGLFAMNRRSGFQPERMVLAGIALGALLDAFVGALAATGDLRAIQLLRWMAGTTYGASMDSALITLGLAVILILPVALVVRWLDLLNLGAVTAAVGLPVRKARFFLFALAAFLTAAATLVVGPLSFVGLMAPHIARGFGFQRAPLQLAMAALSGGVLMVLADWIGRTANYPYEMPAGILSALVGTPLLLFLLRGCPSHDTRQMTGNTARLRHSQS